MATTSYCQLLYSASAVRRILNLRSTVKIELKEFAHVIWVWIKGKRPTFMSKRLFKQHFVEHRKQQAQQIRVQQRQADLFVAFNPQRSTNYIIETRDDGVFCTCEDLNHQLAFWNTGCCKHGYAVLAYLGFSSLRDFLMARKVTPLRRVSEPAARYAA